MAQYVDESLGANEQIVMRGRWPLAHWAMAWLILIVLGVVVIGVYIFIRRAVRMLTTEFAVTNKRVILKWGWLNRHTQELTVESIESVQLVQSIWGRIFGYGRLTVTGTGDARIIFPPMAEPVKFRRAIETSRGAKGAEAGKAERSTDQPAG
jgi:uncharacterized membrane protein YdbT with pleckstrin-like domain